MSIKNLPVVTTEVREMILAKSTFIRFKKKNYNCTVSEPVVMLSAQYFFFSARELAELSFRRYILTKPSPLFLIKVFCECLPSNHRETMACWAFIRTHALAQLRCVTISTDCACDLHISGEWGGVP